ARPDASTRRTPRSHPLVEARDDPRMAIRSKGQGMNLGPVENYCAMPDCDKQRANGMTLPICAEHTRQVYMETKSLLELAKRIYPPDVAAGPTKSKRAKRNTLDEPGEVYFLLIGEGVVKVGFSTNVKQRAKALQAKAVLCHYPGTRRDERAMHARLGPYWI